MASLASSSIFSAGTGVRFAACDRASRRARSQERRGRTLKGRKVGKFFFDPKSCWEHYRASPPYAPRLQTRYVLQRYLKWNKDLRSGGRLRTWPLILQSGNPATTAAEVHVS